MDYKLDTKKPHTAILCKLLSLASIGAMIFTPGIPQIMKFFRVPEGDAQSVLTVFLVGYAIGQIIYSPFANRFGRKPTIYAGLFVAMVGALLSALSGTFESFFLLIVARLITALGASVGLVLSMTIINDFYYEQQARKIVPIVSTAFAIVPFLGVAIGGVLVHHLGWMSPFYFLFLYYLAALFFSMRLPETGTHLEKKETHLSVVSAKYIKAFKDRRLLFFSSLFGITTAMIYIFGATAPLIAVDVLEINSQEYGFINLIIAAFYFGGNLLASRLNRHYPSTKVIFSGFIIFGAAFVILFILFMMKWVTPWTFFIPFIAAYFAYPLAFSNAIVLASNHFEDKATGSAVMNFINIVIAMGGTFIAQFLPEPITTSMPSLMLGLTGLYLIVFLYAKRFA